MDTLKDRTARGMAWGMLNNGATQILNLAIGIFLARLLSPSDYGIVGVLAIFSAIAGNLQSCGFTQALTNMKSPTANDFNAVFWFNIMVSVAAYAVLFMLSPLIAAYFRQGELVSLSRLVFLSFVISALGITPGAYMFKHLMVKQAATIGIVALAVSGTAGIVMAWRGMAYWSLAWQQVIYASIVMVGRYLSVPWRPSTRIDLSPIRRMFGFSINILFTTILNTLSQNVLTFIFGRLFPMGTVGNFTQANKWSFMAYSFLTGTVQQVAQPVLSEVGDDSDREKRVLRKMTRFAAMLTFPAMLGLAMVADEFICVTISAKWAGCVPLLRMLCVGGAFMPFHTLYQNLAISRGRSDIYLWCNILLIGLQVGAVLLTARLGIKAMVGAYTAVTILFLMAWQAIAHRLIGLRVTETARDTLPFLLAACFMVAATYLPTRGIESHVALLLVRIALAAALYIAVMRAFRVRMFQESLDYFRKGGKG